MRNFYTYASKYIACLLIGLIASLSARADQYLKTRSYGISDGLLSHHISSISQDRHGILWIATWNGVAYFDGSKFTTFRGSNESGPLSSNRINEILNDSNGNVWVLTFDRDVNILDVSTGKFNNIRALLNSSDGREFMGKGFADAGNHIWVFGDTKSPDARIDITLPLGPDAIEIFPPSSLAFGADEILKVEVDDKGNEWIFTNKGVQLYGSDVAIPGRFIEQIAMGDNKTYILDADGKIYSFSPDSNSLVNEDISNGISRIYAAVPYDSAIMLIATDKGLLIYDTASGRHQTVASDTIGPITEINIDSRGRIWTFTAAGDVVLYPKPHAEGRKLATLAGRDGTSTVVDIWLEDRFGNIWLAPAHKSFCLYDEASGKLIPQVIKPNAFASEGVAPIEAFYVDNQNNLWFTSNHYLSVVNFVNENFRCPKVTSENDEVRAFGRLSDGSMLLGTSAGYLMRHDNNGNIKSYITRTGTPDNQRIAESATRKVFSPRIYSIICDNRDNIWVGTKGEGLFVISPSGDIRNFRHNAADRYSLPCDSVYDILQDGNDRIWVATYGGGVVLANPADNARYRFIGAHNDMKDYPKPFSRVRRLTQTPDNVMIASCTDGLMTFSDKFSTPADIRFYTSRHIPGDSTSLSGDNVMQTLLASDGSIYVLPLGEKIQKIASTDLLADNLKFTSLYAGNNPHSILNSTANFGNSLSLVENKNHNIVIGYEAVIVVYDPTTGNAYTLASESMDGDMGFTEAKPLLNPETGEIWYGGNGSAIIVSPENVKVSPYVPRIVITGIQFQGESSPRHILNPSEITVPPGLHNISISFAALDYPESANIQYAYRLDGDPDWTYIDNVNTVYLNALEPGLHRLYLRSTNADGIWQDNILGVNLMVKPTFAESFWAKILYVLLVIVLLAFGLYAFNIYRRNQMMKTVHKKEREFFIQASHKLRTPLTLIGGPVSEVLANEQLSDINRQHLIRVHRNALEMLNLVDSMLKQNLDEYFVDDANAAAYITPITSAVSSAVIPEPEALPAVPRQPEEERPANDDQNLADRTSILIVEDNTDLREFLYDILSPQYHVYTAKNGIDGLAKAEKHQPDFIITDVMMPEMDGLTMVHNIKQNKELSHIPIIVLSAKASVDDRVQGLREGVDDYITKPFSATYLRQRIASIIAQRSILQQSYFEHLGNEMAASISNTTTSSDTNTDSQQQTPATPSPDNFHLESPGIIDADQEMMDRLLKYIESRLSDENLKIEELADAVNMGRTVFYSKIKALVGMSPSDFVRRLRMQRAEELIVKSKLNFSQIAYNVGYSDPKYFTKCFKKETGMTPSEYRQKKSSEPQPD